MNLTPFNLENILSSLALETGTVNNNLMINSTSLQPLGLAAAKILCHVTRYETLAKGRIFFSYSTNPYQCSKRSEIDNSSQLPLTGLETAHMWERINYFALNVFFCLQMMT